MKRFLIFTLLFPPLALAVFTAPDGFKNFFDWLGYAYPAAIIPAWLTAGMDWKLSAKPTYLRIVGTTFSGAVITGSIAFFMWGWVRGILSSPHGYACGRSSCRSVFVAVRPTGYRLESYPGQRQDKMSKTPVNCTSAFVVTRPTLRPRSS